MKRKAVVFLVVLMFVISLFYGFSMPSYAMASSGPSTQEIVQAVLKAKAERIKSLMKSPKVPKELLDKKGFKNLPVVTIDGVKIPKDVVEARHIKTGNDTIQIAIDCPSKPLLLYAKKHGLTLKQAANKQLSLMKKNHELIKNKLLSIGVNLSNIHDMYVAYNGIAADVKIKDILTMYKKFGLDNDIRRIYNNNFKKTNIHIERLYKPVDDYSNPLIGAGSSGVWSDPGVDGTGMYVGVVDTGIDYTHPDFGGHPGISFPTTKVPAGYDFGDNDPDPMDCQGHGTHVSGIIAADGVVKGVAPKAKIIIAKIVPGCTGSASDIVIAEAFDYMADPNNVDGGPEGTHPPVASVNMSFGADYGFVDPTEPDQEAIEACIASGIPVALAAGNAGSSLYNLLHSNYALFPDSASIGSPAVTPNCMAVAASWNTASRYPALTELSSGNKYAYTVGAESPDPVTALGDNGGAGYEYVYCGLGGSASDFPASVSGKIALIQRGTYTFETKINNAAAAGAIGVIIFNHTSGGDSLITMEMGSATLPSVFIGHSAGEALLAHAQNAGGDGTGRIAFYPDTYKDLSSPVDTITDFSSWGPPPDLSFKPDITAPGGGIWSTVPVAQGSYANYSGTSMATPHVTACMALVKEANPSYTPEQIKTVLMNTSKLIIDPATGLPYSPHIMGAGRVDIYNALHANATVVNKADGKPFVALGEVPDYKTNPITFTVTITNNNSNAVTYDISTTAQTVYWYGEAIPLHATLTTNPSGSVTVPAGGSKDVTVTITNVPDWYYNPYVEGFVVFTPQGATPDAGGVPAGQIHIPYMGILGKWNDFNENDWQFNPVMDPAADDPAAFLSYIFGTPVTWPEITDGSSYWDTAGVDFYGHLDENAIAFNPNSAILEADFGALRNIYKMDISITDHSGNPVYNIAEDYYLPKMPDPSWYGWYWYFYSPYTGLPYWWFGTNSSHTPVPDGKYYLKLSATPPKIFNKSNYDSPQVIKFPVSVDRVPPTTSVSVKTNPDGTDTLSWTVSDQSPSSGIWGFAIILNDNLNNVILLPPTARSYKVNSIPNGPHPFRVMAIDNANNVGVGHPPIVKVSAKTVSVNAGGVASVPFKATDPDGDELKLSVTVSPVFKGTYEIKGSAVYIKPAPGDVGTNYTFTVIATDPAGYSGSDSFKLVVIKPQDVTPPTVELAGVNMNATPLMSTSSFSFRIVASDDSGSIARVVITDNGIVMKDVYGYLDNVNLPLFEGENTVVVKVYDRAGNFTVKEFTVISDTKAPQIKLATLPKTVTSSKFVLTGSVFDAVSGVASLVVNGKNVTISSNGDFSVELKLEGGENTIVLVAEDRAGNTVTKTYKINYVPQKVQSIMITLQIGNPNISVNGISKKIDAQGSEPVIKNNRTLLPVRALIEALGGTIAWNAKSRQVEIELNGHSIVLTIGKDMALVDGIKTPIDPNNSKVVPVIINGRTYLPLRFIAENLGAMVDWDPASKTVSIYYMP